MCYKGSVSEVFNTEFPFKEKDKRKKKKGFPPHPLYKEKEIKKEKETCYKICARENQKKERRSTDFKVFTPLFRYSAFCRSLELLASSKEQPVRRYMEILNQRQKPCDFKVALADVFLLGIIVPAVHIVHFAISSNTARQSLLVCQFLHNIEEALLYVKRGLFVCPCPTHCP